MKYLIILGDGMADYPIAKHNNRTPLMMANKPNIDKLAKLGRTGLFKSIPEDMPKGSEIANMGVLGYDTRKVYQGRGVLEAANMGIELNDTDIAMRCNLICVVDGKIKNHSAGHITSEEANKLVEAINKEFNDKNYHFFPGVSYRHLFVLHSGSTEVECSPPHDFPGKPVKDLLVKPLNEKAKETAEVLNNLILKSNALLEAHPVNIQRKSAGKDMGNYIWFWSPGRKPKMETFQKMYGLSGAVISAVDLVNGIGRYAGFDIVTVEGATGLYDTNYEGKADAALEALHSHDLVYLHVEASDEAGHEGNIDLKVKTIEYLDERIVGRILTQIDKINDKVTIAVLPDHPTPCELRTHVGDPVPFIIYNPTLSADNIEKYDESSVINGHYGTIEGDQFIKAFLNRMA